MSKAIHRVETTRVAMFREYEVHTAPSASEPGLLALDDSVLSTCCVGAQSESVPGLADTRGGGGGGACGP
ncbi:MAG: hypothetical protein ACI82F_004280, partial [Planctomycetota bacterium]